MWYYAQNNQPVGPISLDDLASRIRSGQVAPDTLVFTNGMTQWQAARDTAQLAVFFSAAAPAVAMPGAAPPPIGQRAFELTYRIVGEDVQFVEVELDPGEAAVAEAGGLMYMTSGVQMDTVFGDGSQQPQSSGLMGALMGAGKRLLTGESLFTTVFSNPTASLQKVAFAAPYPGRILPMDLKQLGGELICQKDSFLAAAKGISIGIAFQKKIGVGLFGGEGFIMQRLTGDGLAFVHAGGMIESFDLKAGETLRVDTGCLVALTPSVQYDVQFVGKVKTAFFGGEGLFFAVVTGPGRVWLQSLPLSRMADRIMKAAPGMARGGKEEGSVLGGLGNLLDGDN
ncbi:TIGR00266 family protein [Luteitalea sp.]|jgi:uncharacterized protein (TIGR00266 family)|uniref:TIGR00266 family protein n=1 Tax=Luteitalea sp. TaxID=2004800 RepID=UPI0037CBFBAF